MPYFSNLNFTEGIFFLIFFLALVVLLNLSFKFLFKKLIGRTETELDDKMVKALRLPVLISTILAGFYFYVDTVSVPPETGEVVVNTLLTLAVLVWTYAGVKISNVALEEIKGRQIGAEKFSDAIPFLKNLTKLIIAGFALLVILHIWGIDITPLLASAGVAGIAIAFAAKDTVSNLFGGVSIFFDKPYKVGDYVIIQEEYRGEVIQIGTRSTKIRTLDNILITIPNSVMITQAVINETGFDPKLRIRIPVGVAYGSNLDKVEKIVVDILNKNKVTLDDPEPRVRFRKLGESAIELEATCFIPDPQQKGLVTHELIKKIEKRFKEEKITIPFPQMDVHLKNKETKT